MMSRLIVAILTILSLGTAPPAWAQDDDDGGMTFGDDFALDTLLITTFEAPKELRRTADRYEEFFAETLGAEWMVFRMTDVPAFADYDAATYVDSCPDGQYIACMHAVGVRVQSEYALGGQVFVGADGETELMMSIIDIDDNRLIIQFPVDLDDGITPDLAAGVRRVYERVIEGAYEGTDIRFDDEEPIEQDEVPVEDVGEDEGMTRAERRRGKRKVFTKEDIDRYEDSDAITPWEQKGLNKTSWKRWRNTRLSLMEWKAKARARQGEILISATALTVGQGPWVQVYDGWYGLDSTLEITEKSTVLDQYRGIERAWDFSLGVGVLPWMDVAVFGGPKVAPYSVRVQRVVEGTEPIIDEPIRRVVSSWMVGGRVGFQPLPTFPARPTFHLGAYYWSGVDHTKLVDAPAELAILEKPWMLLVQAAPGFEVNVGKLVYLWGRVYVDVPIAGRVAQESSSAGALIAARPRPDATDDGIGIAGSVGVTIRLRIPGGKPKRGGL